MGQFKKKNSIFQYTLQLCYYQQVFCGNLEHSRSRLLEKTHLGFADVSGASVLVRNRVYPLSSLALRDKQLVVTVAREMEPQNPEETSQGAKTTEVSCEKQDTEKCSSCTLWPFANNACAARHPQIPAECKGPFPIRVIPGRGVPYGSAPPLQG